MITRPLPVALSTMVLLAAWLGAAILVSAVVAPAAFAVLPSRTLAGALVGRVLPALFWSGIVIGILVAVIAFGVRVGTAGTVSAIALSGACVIAQLVISPRIERVRAAIGGPVDALDPSDPRRQMFGRLHAFSVAWLGIGCLAASITLIVTFNFLMQHQTSTR